MLAIQGIGDWIEGIIVLVIIAGSALGGIGKAISAKLNRSREEAAQREGRERPPPRMTERPALPPMARPMPPRRRPPVAMQRPATGSLTPQPAPQRPVAEIPRSFQPVVQSILDVVLDGAVDLETAFPKPQPSQPRREPPPASPRAGRTSVPRQPVRRRSIEDREEQKSKLVEKRIGHVEPHVASSPPPSSTETNFGWFERPTRTDLRRAIILNEILSPPLALRGQP